MTHPTLRYGSRGDDVTRWQRILDVTRDGVFGVKTQTATEAWQRARGLHPDGIVGPKTWARADAEVDPMGESAPTPPSPSPIPPFARVATLEGADEATIRATIVQLAMMRAGLGAKAMPDRYARAIGAHREPASFRHSYVPTALTTNWNASSCGLACRSILADAGVSHPLLETDYDFTKFGGVIGQLGVVAGDHGARVRPASGTMPQAGDMVALGGSSAHILTVTDAGRSADGGQIGNGTGWGGGTEIAMVERSWRRAGSRLFTRNSYGEREVLWWINVAALSYAFAVDWPAW